MSTAPTREFPTIALASLSSGVTNLGHWSAAHRAAEYLLGRTVTVDEFTNWHFWHAIQPALQQQHPDLPFGMDLHVKPATLQATIDELEARLGKTLRIHPITENHPPMTSQELVKTLRPHVDAIKSAAAAGDKRASQVISLYEMHRACPNDPGALALCGVVFADYLATKDAQ